jgi:hypothetical protein
MSSDRGTLPFLNGGLHMPPTLARQKGAEEACSAILALHERPMEIKTNYYFSNQTLK